MSLQARKASLSNIVRLSLEVIEIPSLTSNPLQIAFEYISRSTFPSDEVTLKVSDEASLKVSDTLESKKELFKVSDELDSNKELFKVSEELDSNKESIKVSDELESKKELFKVSDELDSDEVNLRGFDAINDVRANPSFFELFFRIEIFLEKEFNLTQ